MYLLAFYYLFAGCFCSSSLFFFQFLPLLFDDFFQWYVCVPFSLLFFVSIVGFWFVVTMGFLYVALQLYLHVLNRQSFKFKHTLKDLHFLLPSPTICGFYVIFHIFMFIPLLIIVVIVDFIMFCLLIFVLAYLSE